MSPASGYYNKSSSPSKKPSKNVAADKPPPPSPNSPPSRSNVAFDIGLPPSGGGSYNRVGGQKQALGTFFNGVGSPFGGCGTMASQLFDDNGKPLPFIALNFQDSSVSAPYQQPATGGSIGAFENGANCGRWIEITVGDNCKGGKNTDTGVCIGGGTLPVPVTPCPAVLSSSARGDAPQLALNKASVGSL